MKIFIKHIIKNLEEKIGRTLLIVLTLSGVAVIVSFIFTIVFGFGGAVVEMWSGKIAYDYEITSTRAELSYEYLENTNPDLILLGIRKEENGYILKKGKYTPISLISYDFEKAKAFDFLKEENAKLEEDEMLVSSEMSGVLGVRMGKTITYYNENGQEFKLKLKYIGTDRLSQYGDYIIVNEETYNKISTNKDQGQYDVFLGIYKGTEPKEEYTKKLYEIEDEYGLHYSDISEDLSLNISSIIKVLLVVFVISFIIVFFVLNSIVKIIMEERIPIVGSFRSVGASNLKMNLILIGEMGLYGLVGGLLGSSFTLSIMGSMISQIKIVSYEMGNSANTAANLDVLILVGTTIAMILFQIILSITEILGFNSLSIKECMFNSKQRKFKREIGRLIIGIVCLIISIIGTILSIRITYWLGFVALISLFTSISLLLPYISYLFEKIFKIKENPILTMAYNTINNNKLQISTNVIVTILLTISIIAISFLNAYINNNKLTLDFVKSDIIVSLAGEPAELQNEISKIENVKELSSLYIGQLFFDDIEFANNELYSLDVLYSDNSKSLKNSLNSVEVDFNKWDNLKSDEMIVSYSLRDKYNLKEGDIVKISLIENYRHFPITASFDLKIVGFAKITQVSQTFIILKDDVANGIASLYQAYLYVNVNDKNDLDKTIEQINELSLNSLNGAISNETYLQQQQLLMGTTSGLVYAIIAIFVGVGLIGIINNQSVSIIERSKELAILYSVCMSRKQISRMIFREIAISYLISSLTALVYSILLNSIVVNVVNSIADIGLSLEANILWTLVLLLVLSVIMYIIYLSAKIKIKNMNIVEELKYE